VLLSLLPHYFLAFTLIVALSHNVFSVKYGNIREASVITILCFEMVVQYFICMTVTLVMHILAQCPRLYGDRIYQDIIAPTVLNFMMNVLYFATDFFLGITITFLILRNPKPTLLLQKNLWIIKEYVCSIHFINAISAFAGRTWATPIGSNMKGPFYIGFCVQK
jgi:hypothetical protein